MPARHPSQPCRSSGEKGSGKGRGLVMDVRTVEVAGTSWCGTVLSRTLEGSHGHPRFSYLFPPRMQCPCRCCCCKLSPPLNAAATGIPQHLPMLRLRLRALPLLPRLLRLLLTLLPLTLLLLLLLLLRLQHLLPLLVLLFILLLAPLEPLTLFVPPLRLMSSDFGIVLQLCG